LKVIQAARGPMRAGVKCCRLLGLLYFAAVPHHRPTRDSLSRLPCRRTTYAGLNGRLRRVGSMTLKRASASGAIGVAYDFAASELASSQQLAGTSRLARTAVDRG